LVTILEPEQVLSEPPVRWCNELLSFGHGYLSLWHVLVNVPVDLTIYLNIS
jgi:hypothetical protein